MCEVSGRLVRVYNSFEADNQYHGNNAIKISGQTRCHFRAKHG